MKERVSALPGPPERAKTSKEAISVFPDCGFHEPARFSCAPVVGVISKPSPEA